MSTQDTTIGWAENGYLYPVGRHLEYSNSTFILLFVFLPRGTSRILKGQALLDLFIRRFYCHFKYLKLKFSIRKGHSPLYIPPILLFLPRAHLVVDTDVDGEPKLVLEVDFTGQQVTHLGRRGGCVSLQRLRDPVSKGHRQLHHAQLLGRLNGMTSKL